MLKLETLKTTESTEWSLHETYFDYHEAFCMIGFFKNQGYACVKIVQQSDSLFTIHVLRNKGA